MMNFKSINNWDYIIDRQTNDYLKNKDVNNTMEIKKSTDENGFLFKLGFIKNAVVEEEEYLSIRDSYEECVQYFLIQAEEFNQKEFNNYLHQLIEFTPVFLDNGMMDNDYRIVDALIQIITMYNERDILLYFGLLAKIFEFRVYIQLNLFKMLDIENLLLIPDTSNYIMYLFKNIFQEDDITPIHQDIFDLIFDLSFCNENKNEIGFILENHILYICYTCAIIHI